MARGFTPEQELRMHLQAVDTIAQSLLDIIRCGSAEMSYDRKVELAAKHRAEWPELWRRIDELAELIPVRTAPML